MRIRVPASSANLGPGFDAMGLALSLPFDVSVGAADDELLPADEHHPLTVAYRRAGGSSQLWWRSPIPPGRGLGFSGSARVAGALAGFLEVGCSEEEARRRGLELAIELEQHPDNAAASMLGGAVVSAGGISLRIPLARPWEVVVWWPDTETSTNAARAALRSEVPFADAVFNVGRASLLVAALVTGDRAALAIATEDRLHTDQRLELSPASTDALRRLSAAGPLACWLSGSGPTVAALVEPGHGEELLGSVPPSGTARVLDIDDAGAQLL